jgi:dolichol kinase
MTGSVQTPEEISLSTPPGHPPLHHAATIDFRAELIRKAIHLCSLSIPTIYYFISRETALAILVPLALLSLLVDVARYRSDAVARWFYRWFRFLLRERELDSRMQRLTGATNILLSAVACVLVFPKILTVHAFAILIVADITSALVGRRYGKHPFLAKSREGTVAFFVAASAVVFIAPKLEGLTIEYGIALLAAAIGAVVEASSTRIDDNITVPFSIGAVMWLLYVMLLPSVNLYALQ